MYAAARDDVIELATFAETAEPEVTPPDPARLIFALRQIGYNVEQALADLIDNSIAAGARMVLIRFLCDSARIRSLAVVDDGCGMSETELSEAMRFGSLRERERLSLGKFGMGLKLASFSHARALTVLSHRNGQASGRRWTIDGIEAGWTCEVLDSTEVSSQLQRRWGGVDLKAQGTAVLWDDIDRFSEPTGGLRAALRNLQRRLEVHLGLAFHRYLEEGRLRIEMDQQVTGTREHNIRIPVKPLNPFAYPQSGSPEYPKTFDVSMEGIGKLKADAHIWPPNSEQAEYRLGYRAASRQGFYFYRNDRLIQAGGWNGVVRHDTEPHSSLARVKVDLPPELDSMFGLNVQKSAVVVPTGFEAAVAESRTADGVSFEAFRKQAQLVYRKQDRKAHRLLPAVPGKGVPGRLRRLAETSLNGGESGVRAVDIRWEELPDDMLFDIDRQESVLILNRNHRGKLLNGRRAKPEDLPLFKTLMFLLLKDEFSSDRVSALRRTRLASINELVVEAILMERS
jgi:hypothetical protein